MNNRTKLGLGVLEAALLLGLLGDALLRATPWGLNLFFWIGALVTAVMALARRKGVSFTGDGDWLIPTILLTATAFAWRDSLTLQVLDALTIGGLLSLAAWRARKGCIRLAGVAEYALSLVAASLNAVGGAFPLLLSDVRWKEIPRAGWSQHALGVARGLAIALPLLLVFGALFMAADAIFEGIIQHTFRLDFDELLTHVFLLLFFAWISGGFLRGMLLGTEVADVTDIRTLLRGRQRHDKAEDTTALGETKDQKNDAPPRRASGRASLGIVEISVVLGLLNLLFCSFVGVQLRYLFGGAAWVINSTGLTYAEYARRGFFEMVWVALLALPVLLIAHWLLHKENAAHVRIFRALAGMHLVLLFVILASAVKRMQLYQSEYGLTELRLYTTAFMGWLALVFIWFAVTVLLRNQRERFACGALVAGLAVIAMLHLLNPDALIVRTNVAHAKNAGRPFDAGYAASLSADAVPALIDALPAMTDNRDSRAWAATLVLERWSPPEGVDWRTWNWARAEAWRAVREHEATLRALAGPPAEDSVPPHQAGNMTTETAPEEMRRRSERRSEDDDQRSLISSTIDSPVD